MLHGTCVRQRSRTCPFRKLSVSVFIMDEEFSDTFLGFARPAELAPEELERPSAPSTGGRGGRSHARPRPANAAAAAGRREGLGDAMLDGINRNDERCDSVRRERDLDSLIENAPTSSSTWPNRRNAGAPSRIARPTSSPASTSRASRHSWPPYGMRDLYGSAAATLRFTSDDFS